jgi:hypothetical protein
MVTDEYDLPGLTIQVWASVAVDVRLYLLMLFDRLGLDPVIEATKEFEFNKQRFPVEKTFDPPASRLKALKHLSDSHRG